MNRRLQALGRMKAGKRNRTEAEYEVWLTLRQHAGEIAWFRFEGITLKLADDTRYTADFAVMLADGRLQLHEVKGVWTDDAKVKVKIAAASFPIPILIVKKTGNNWTIEEV